jgi:hypothetical protein
MVCLAGASSRYQAISATTLWPGEFQANVSHAINAPNKNAIIALHVIERVASAIRRGQL